MSAALYPAGLVNLILWRAANPNHREQPMSYAYIRSDGIVFHGSTPRDLAVSAVEEALRRQAHAAYGRALLEADYSTPVEERQARYDELRAAVEAAQRTLAEALGGLEDLL